MPASAAWTRRSARTARGPSGSESSSSRRRTAGPLHRPPTVVENTLGITPVSGKVRTYTFNGKAERFFRTFKEWARLVLFALLGDKKAMARSIQEHFERYRGWFNRIRVHQGIGGQTPEQAWSGTGLPAAKIVRARDLQPGILVSRRTFEDDPHLPVVNIEVEWAEAA